MSYHQFPPDPILNQFIQCFWSVSSNAEILPTLEHGVIPGGYVDLVFNVGAPVRQVTSGQLFVDQARSFVIGPFDRLQRFRVEGQFEFLGVRFHLGRFPFSRLPLREARNRALPLDGLWEQQGLKAKIQALECRLAQEADTAERIACVERFLKEFLQHCSEPDTVVTEALDLIEETKGQISVEALAEAVGMSDRQLERKFTLHVGLLPKAFCRVARFRQVKSLLESALRPTSCDLAYACGYYDQTHLIREFRLFTGQTPAHYERVQSVGFFLYESQMTC